MGQDCRGTSFGLKSCFTTRAEVNVAGSDACWLFEDFAPSPCLLPVAAMADGEVGFHAKAFIPPFQLCRCPLLSRLFYESWARTALSGKSGCCRSVTIASGMGVAGPA